MDEEKRSQNIALAFCNTICVLIALSSLLFFFGIIEPNMEMADANRGRDIAIGSFALILVDIFGERIGGGLFPLSLSAALYFGARLLIKKDEQKNT